MESGTLWHLHQLHRLGLPLRRLVLLFLPGNCRGHACHHELEHCHVWRRGHIRHGLLHPDRQTPLQWTRRVAQARAIGLRCIWGGFLGHIVYIDYSSTQSILGGAACQRVRKHSVV